MDDKEKEMKAWEEYTGKANNFADWFTAVIISNFAYLIGFVDNKEKIGSFWYGSFLASGAALILIFVIKVLGVWAAKMRFDKEKIKDDKWYNECQHNIESVRDILSAFFVVLGLFALILTGYILKAQLF